MATIPDQPNSAGLRRDLDILDVLASDECRRRGGLGVVRIAERLGRENSQVSRALRALAAAGMVERDPHTLDYRLGWRLYSYAARTYEALLVHVAAPFVRRLVATLHETGHLCVHRGNQLLTLWTENAAGVVSPPTWDGVSVPVVSSSAGRVLLSDWDTATLRTWFSDADLAGSGPRPRIVTVDELITELARIRQRGYGVVRDEFEVGVVGCSAPVRDHRGRVVAAVTVSAPTARLGAVLDKAGRLTARCAADISAALKQTLQPTGPASPVGPSPSATPAGPGTPASPAPSP
ncbi:MAG: IclR family transcriptional regulator [Acidothermales bacterium]|nr:IclR family transcriptional regulator [Acidothermales bacterium]